MPLQHAVLALLAAKPAHGYELKASFEEAVGEQWGGLNIGHLYQILDRLRRDGLVETERQPQPIKPDRLIHHLTPAGRLLNLTKMPDVHVPGPPPGVLLRSALPGPQARRQARHASRPQRWPSRPRTHREEAVP